MNALDLMAEAGRRFPGFNPMRSRVVEVEGGRIPAPGPVCEGVAEETDTVEMEDLGGGVSIGYSEELDTLVIRRG